MGIVAFTAMWPLPMGEVRNVVKHLQNLMDYIRIWGNQLHPEHFQNMKNNKTRKLWRFFLFSLERLTSNNGARFLNKNMTFIVTFLLKQCLHVKNELQLL